MPQQACTLSACTPATVRRPLSVVPLLLLLLFLCCASVCVAWGGGSVESTGVVRELPRTGQSGVQAYTVATKEDWKLIRIVASKKDLEDDKKYCTEANVELSISDFKTTCYEKDIMTVEKKNLMETIIPAAIKLHRDRLLVRPVIGKWKVPQLINDSLCGIVTVPDEHRKEGVDADFVLYVLAIPGSSGLICARAERSGRPIAGAMNFIPHLHGGLRLNVRRAAHEIAHALGFNMDEMLNKSMLSEVSIRGDGRFGVKTREVLEKARAHYNCPALDAMELEHDENNEAISHWDRRLAKDELMAPTNDYGAGYYTALTMALFEDLGYYKANWGMAEPMSWGNQSGCVFLKKKCHKDNKLIYPQFFCNKTISRCTSDRSAYGRCTVETLDDHMFYDVCEITESYIMDEHQQPIYTYCTGNETDLLPGSLMGPDSWCLDGENLMVAGKNGTHAKEVNGVCAKVLCDEKKRTVKVQYKGDKDKWHDCPEGTSIVVKSSVFQGGGKIKCPKYDEVCTIASNGSSRVLLGVKPPAAPGGSTSSGSTSSGETSVRKDQGNKGVHSNSETDRNGSAAQEPKTPSATGSRNRRDTAAVNPSRTSDNTQIGGAAATASPSGKDKANTNAPLQYPEGVTQAHIDLLQNGTALRSQIGTDGALSAACSLPIVILLMVLAVVLPC